jgi:LAO/AO transport system kinase
LNVVTDAPKFNRVRFQEMLDGEPRAIARALSVVEDETPESAALVAALFPHTGRAYVVGITGAPGSGKSTLVDRLIAEARREQLTVGVIAVDPSSPFTGGAILGDRVRMNEHAADTGVFIRSMATRGHLGGLSRATGDAAIVLDAAGRDIIIIETVGVGQAEVDIVRTADCSIVVLVPGAGDDVQALKAGIMEIADIFVVNKADREGAERVVQAVSANLSLQTFAPGDWQPPILKTAATAGAGIDALWGEVRRFREQSGDRRRERERLRHETRLRDLLGQRFLQHIDRTVPAAEFARLVDAITARALDPYSAADQLMRAALNGSANAGPYVQ